MKKELCRKLYLLACDDAKILRVHAESTMFKHQRGPLIATISQFLSASG